MRNIMSDAGLAGPLPELLFPSVLLATALILLFNAVVVFPVCCRHPSPFSGVFPYLLPLLLIWESSCLASCSYTLFYIVAAVCFSSLLLFSFFLVSLLILQRAVVCLWGGF
ncbi:hypothetical protein F4802DRAFT_573624 [Xylaria palmicola]|nr:hypothetical protein F4802DRAFT_573624 [Xylaria palmicola]